MGREITSVQLMPITRITIRHRRGRIRGISAAGSRLASLARESYDWEVIGLPSKGGLCMTKIFHHKFYRYVRMMLRVRPKMRTERLGLLSGPGIRGICGGTWKERMKLWEDFGRSQ